MNGNELLTVQEVAARLKMNPETVRRWLRDGKLQGYLLGGDRGGYRVAESDLKEFMAGRRTAAEGQVLEADG
ncbi:MAG: helix-turn-helix domain-containing protein [Chloroflexi bacterium]|nr:helix-turn-helix domain-containing protein [Chloroflexota bacterium]